MYRLRQFVKLLLNRMFEWKVLFIELSKTNLFGKKKNLKYLETQILLTAHSLEKGMGLKESRSGFGYAKAQNLVNHLRTYIQKKGKYNHFSFLEGLVTLKGYLHFQKEKGVSFSDIEEAVVEFESKLSVEEVDRLSQMKCGYHIIESSQMLEAAQMDFDRFTSLRHSVRAFQDTLVDIKTIQKAIEIANRAPSACNRQPIKVYCNQTVNQAREIDQLLTGTTGFKNMVNNFAIITSDRFYFAGTEQLQWYINGGIYLSYFTLALHSLGIGHCILQWFAFYKTEKQLKKLLGISDEEAIIAVVALGYLPNEVKCIYAQRKTVEETLVLIDEES